MLNQGMVAYPYVETTTAPVAGGILEDMPRLDYSNGSCPSLLLEPSRTNILVNSEYFAGGAYNSTLVTQNYGTSPEGITNSALIDKNGVRYGRLDYSLNYPSGTYTFSAFVKGNDVVKLRLDYGAGPSKEAYINCANGQTTNHPYYPMDSISSVDYGNGWYRFICTTAIPNGFTLSFARIYVMDVVDGEGNTNPATAEIYGAQLEQDATYPTSYIPTYGVSQTRLEDDCLKTGISSLIGQTEGTLFIEWEQQLSDDVYAMFGLNDGSNNNRVHLALNQSGSSRLGLVYRVNGTAHFSDVNIQSLNVGTIYLAAVVYTQTTLKMYLNGSIVVDYSGFSASGGTFNELNFKLQSSGSSFPFAMPTNQALVFPTALSDEACIELTTIS
jgi:hypothetical protein